MRKDNRRPTLLTQLKPLAKKDGIQGFKFLLGEDLASQVTTLEASRKTANAIMRQQTGRPNRPHSYERKHGNYRDGQGRGRPTQPNDSGRRRRNTTPTSQALEAKPDHRQEAWQGDEQLQRAPRKTVRTISTITKQYTAGGVTARAATWNTITNNSWILNMVKGVRLELTGLPLQGHCPTSKNKGPGCTLENKVEEMLTQGVIKPATEGKRAFISHLFLRPKKDRGLQTNT